MSMKRRKLFLYGTIKRQGNVLKSRIKCANCNASFMVDEKDLAQGKVLECPECRQPLGEKFLDQLKNAFRSLHEYQKK